MPSKRVFALACLLTFVVGSLVGSCTMTGCTAVQTIDDDRQQRALLILEVEPPSTEVYIDSDYRGVVEGWTGHAVPVEPGHRRVELRADHYITRRFDVRAEAGEQVVLRVRMEPSLEKLD